MQHVAIFEEQVVLTPKDMRSDIDSIDGILMENLAAALEGRCSRHGYVLAGTLKMLSRSMGALDKGRFTGNIIFSVKAEAEVLNPPDGTVLEGEVIRKNKMGIYVSYKDAIRIIIPRDLYVGDESYDAVQIGEIVQAEIKKSRFQVNDPYILSVGMFRSSKGKKAEPAPARVPAPAPARVPVAENDFGEDEEEDEDEDINELAKAFDAEDKESGDEEVE